MQDRFVRGPSEAAAALLVSLGSARDAHLLDGARPDAEAREALARHAAAKRRHLVLENAVVLPLARLRLDGGRRRALRAGMAGRCALGPLEKAG